MSDTRYRCLVSVKKTHRDYINISKKLRKGEKRLNTLMKMWKKKREDNKGKRRLESPLILGERPGRVFEAMIRHGLDNELLIFDHCWDVSNMSIRDFHKAFATAMNFLNSIDLTEEPETMDRILRRREYINKEKEKEEAARRGNQQQQTRRS